MDDARSGAVRIEDEITAPIGDVVWRAFTDASIDGDTVTLKKQGKRITLRRVGKAGVWSLVKATPPNPKEKQNEKFTAIVLTAPKAEMVSLGVELKP